MAELVDEGSAASKLRSLIKRVGANTDTRIEFGTVTAAPPSLRILVDGMKIEIDEDDCVVAECLTEYTRKVTISGGTVSGTVSPSGSLTSLMVTDADMTIDGALKVGDRVIVAQINDGQTYVILDRVGGA